MPLDLYVNIRDQRLAALREEFLPRLPSAAGAPLTLELGCGHGHYLTAYAAAHPEEFCVGIDLLADRIERARRKAHRAKLPNLAFVQAEAALFLHALASASPNSVPPPRLRRVFVLFSDPWPKRRHWKRRFVQDATIAGMSRILKQNGEFRFVCDIDDYCAWTLMHMQRSADFIWTAERADDWRLPWPNYTMTRYGRKADREGRKAAYLIFRHARS